MAISIGTSQISSLFLNFAETLSYAPTTTSLSVLAQSVIASRLCSPATPRFRLYSSTNSYSLAWKVKRAKKRMFINGHSNLDKGPYGLVGISDLEDLRSICILWRRRCHVLRSLQQWRIYTYMRYPHLSHSVHKPWVSSREGQAVLSEPHRVHYLNLIIS